MTDEELIEKAFNAHEGAPTWEDDPVGRDAAIRWHMRGFHDALAVFREHTAPTTDEREAWVDDDLYGVIDRAMQRSWTDATEYEYAPSEITDAVRTWMDEQGFRRAAPAEPAVTEVALEARKWLADFGDGYQDFPGGPMRQYDGANLIRKVAALSTERDKT